MLEYAFKIKIPKELIRAGFSTETQIEVGLKHLSREMWNEGRYRVYEVRARDRGTLRTLASTTAMSEEVTEEVGFIFDITAFFPEQNRKQYITTCAGLTGAEETAHRKALEIAAQISDYAGLNITDHSAQERAALETEYH